MANTHHDIAGATQLGGANAGLFTFDGVTLTQGQRIKIKSLVAHLDGASATWTVYLEDPVDQAKSILLLTGTGNDVDFFPAGRYVSRYGGSNANDLPWQLKVVTTGKDDAGWIECDWGVE